MLHHRRHLPETVAAVVVCDGADDVSFGEAVDMEFTTGPEGRIPNTYHVHVYRTAPCHFVAVGFRATMPDCHPPTASSAFPDTVPFVLQLDPPTAARIDFTRIGLQPNFDIRNLRALSFWSACHFRMTRNCRRLNPHSRQ